MNERASLFADGYDLTVELSCGDTLRLLTLPGVPDPERGDYYSCQSHSQIYGYDPHNGDPLYERDRQVIEVRREL